MKLAKKVNENVYLMATILCLAVVFHIIDPLLFLEKLGYATIAMLSLCELLEQIKSIFKLGVEKS